MWRIYTSRENLFRLADAFLEEGILGFHFVENDVYLSDAGYKRVIDHVQSHNDFGDFSSEYVSIDDFKAIINNLQF